MIDVDERGRAAAADLLTAVGATFDTDAAWQASLTRAAVPVRAASRRSRPQAWTIATVGAVAVIAVVALVAAERADAPPSGRPLTSLTSVATSIAATSPPTSANPTSTAPATPQTFPSSSPAVTSALASVATRDALPAVVSVTHWPFEVAIDAVPVPVPAYPALFAIEAPDGRLVIERAGDGFGRNVVYDPATGAESQIPEAGDDGMRVDSAGDSATVEGVAIVIARRADPCNTEGAPCSRGEIVLMALDGGQPSEVVISLPGTSFAGEPITGTGRFSVSDSGLVAGVAQLSETANVALLIDSTAGGDPLGPSATALGSALGLNTGTDDPARRIDAVTVDQSGRAVAWLDPGGVTVADLATGDRRTFALPGRPVSALPVIDLALSTSGISDGAVLLSGYEGTAFVIDLTDGSVAEVPGFNCTLTFSAVPPTPH